MVADSQTADLTLMRELNEQTVLTLIREDGPISRAELARRSHLSRSTISSIIASLLAANYVYETGIGSSQGGRRPIMLDFNYRACFVVGVDVATTTLTLLLTDLQAQVLRRVHLPFDLTAGPEICIPHITALYFEALQHAGVAPTMIGAVSIGIPGPLSSLTDRAIAPPVMPGWHDVPLRSLLEQALGQQVFLENDANLGALAEQTWGAAREVQNVAYIYLASSGIGGGLILDGNLYRGHIGSAGEIGHLTIDEDGPPCRCGSSGCLEAFIGTPALIELAHQRGLPVATITDLVAYAHRGNAKARAIIAGTGVHLGVAVASLLNLLNPHGIVIGGELAAAGDMLLETLRATLERRGLAVACQNVRLSAGALGGDVIALGGAALAIRHLFRVPTVAISSHPMHLGASD